MLTLTMATVTLREPIFSSFVQLTFAGSGLQVQVTPFSKITSSITFRVKGLESKYFSTTFLHCCKEWLTLIHNTTVQLFMIDASF